MFENNSSNGTRNCGPACEGETLIIEVMGKDCPEGQRFRLFDTSNLEQQEQLENQAETEKLDVSALHAWPWKGQPSGNVWLDIEAEEGSPIRIPLFSRVASTPRQPEGQWNRICPVVPLTLLNDPDPEPGRDSDIIVPVRPGFIYIFRNGTLWRELEVRNSDAGTLEFCDVRLMDYREPGVPGVKSDQRSVVGKPQPSIWLPVCEMNTSIMGEFQLAFSEVQLSARQLTYLELNTAARRARCQSLTGPEPRVASQYSPLQTVAPGQLVWLYAFPEMRLREPELEQRLRRPWKQIYDLSGTYASNLFEQAAREVQDFNAGGESAEEAWEAACYRDCPLRGTPAARVDAFLADRDSEEANTELWQSLASEEDALAFAKANHHACVVLEDRLFSIRHRLAAGLEARRFMNSLLEAIEQKPHGDSAQLVYRLMGPERLGGQENGLHRHFKEIDTSRFGALHVHLLTAQRQLAREELAMAQTQLASLLGQYDNQAAMADLFNLSGADYIEGFACTGDMFQILAMDPTSLDHLARVEAANESQVRDANHLVLKIVEDGSEEPLHCMLFPSDQADMADSVGSGEESGAIGEFGDGRCRPEDLKKLSDEQPEQDAVQTLTAAVLIGFAKLDDIDLSSQTKRWMAGIDAILDGIDKSVRSLANRLKSHAYVLDSRLYGPLLRMAKARDPSLLGSVKLIARNAVPEGWIILGLRDPVSGLDMGLTEADREYVHRTNGHKRFYGEYLDANGTPLASTRKSNVPDLADTDEARRMQVYAAPESSEVVKAQRDLRRMERLDDFLNRVRVPYLVLILEGHNVLTEFSLFQTTFRTKGLGRAVAGGVSSAIDLGFAMTIAAERLSKDVGVWKSASTSLSKTAFTMNKKVMDRASKTISRALPEIVTRRMLGGLVAAGLTITVSLMDMVFEWDTGDLDASAAYGVSAIGGGMMVMGGLMMAKMAEAGVAPVLLGLGPWGWVLAGVTVTIGASLMAAVLDDPPLVDWLKRGPFGPEQDNVYSHLDGSPEETYYRLVDLLAKPRITIGKVNNMQARLSEQGYSLDPWRARDIANINTVVRVENNLSAMLDAATLTVAMRTERITRKSTRRGQRTQRRLLPDSPEVMLEQPLPNGKVFYLALPPRETVEHSWSGEAVMTSEVKVKAQWQATHDFGQVHRNLVFPAPELHEATTFDQAEHGEPDFSKTEQLFWADEQTHKVKEAT